MPTARSWMPHRNPLKTIGKMLMKHISPIQRKSQSRLITPIISLKSMSRNITTHSPTLTTTGMRNFTTRAATLSFLCCGPSSLPCG